MRIACWNVEWMYDWFSRGGDAGLRQANERRGVTSVDELAGRVAKAIHRMNPDVLAVLEGPSDVRDMELFVNTHLRYEHGQARYRVFGGFDGGTQRIYALVKSGGRLLDPSLPSDDLTLDLRGTWEADVDGDVELEDCEFSRVPLVLDGRIGESGKRLRLVVFHVKSRHLHRGETLWNNPATQREFIVAALKNRSRNVTEASRLRHYLDLLLLQDENRRIVVVGDMNDGPGVDFFERHYMTRNTVDVLLGTALHPDRRFHNALIESVATEERYSAIVDDFVDNVRKRRVLLDHILVSPSLRGEIRGAGVAHDVHDEGMDPRAMGRQRQLSDHRPVFLDL